MRSFKYVKSINTVYDANTNATSSTRTVRVLDVAFEKQFRAWPLLAPLFATPVETSVFVRSVLPDATQRARGKEKFDPAYQPRVRPDAPDEDDGFNRRRVSSRTQLDSTIERVI